MKFEYFKNGWSLNEWQNECPELTYKIVDVKMLPDWLPSGLIKKFNCAVIASSGNTSICVGIIMGYRIYKDEIDEHPFVVAFDKKNLKEYSGIINHGNWFPGRTTGIPVEMKRLIALSGLAVNFRFERKPEFPSGTLDDLKSQGILNGYEKTISIIEKDERLLLQQLPASGVSVFVGQDYRKFKILISR